MSRRTFTQQSENHDDQGLAKKVKAPPLLFKQPYTVTQEQEALASYPHLVHAFQSLSQIEWSVLHYALSQIMPGNVWMDEPAADLLDRLQLNEKSLTEVAERFSAPSPSQFVPYTLVRHILTSMQFTPTPGAYVQAIEQMQEALEAKRDIHIQYQGSTVSKPLTPEDQYLLDWLRGYQTSRVLLNKETKPTGPEYYYVQADLSHVMEEGQVKVAISIYRVEKPNFMSDSLSFADRVQAYLVLAPLSAPVTPVITPTPTE